MRSYFLRFATALTLITAFSLTTPVTEAYEIEPKGESEVEVEPERESAIANPSVESSGPVNPGTLDFSLSMGGFFYNWAEPGVDLGLIPIGDGLTLSVGGSINAGYCLIGCALFNWLLTPLNLNAWHVNPMARVALHFNMISEAFDLPSMNIYGGLLAGPAFYRVSLTLDDDPANASLNQTTFVIGPMAGLRYTFSGNTGFFVSLEGRFLMEFGANAFVLTDSTGREYREDGWINRGGSNIGVGIGFRL